MWTQSINWALKEKIEFDYAMKYNNSIYITDEVKELVSQEFSVFDGIITKGFEEKLFRNESSKLIWSVFSFMSLGIVNYLLETAKRDEKIIAEGFDMFWSAVKK